MSSPRHSPDDSDDFVPAQTGRYLDAVEVAERYGIATRTVYSLVDQKMLPAHKVGKRLLRFSADDLAEFERRSSTS